MRHDPTFWLLARASGMAAYVLLTSSVLAGLALKSRVLGLRVRPPIVTDIHRFLALLGLGALSLHGAALVLDSMVYVSPLGLLVPGLIGYRPLWTALGVVAAELMLLVYVSFPLRKRIGARLWRKLHWLTYAIFIAATTHGIAAGSDSGYGWAAAVYTGAIAAVAAATAWRVLVPPLRSTQRRIT